MLIIFNFLAHHIIKIYNMINYEIHNTTKINYRYYYDKYKTHWRAQFIERGTFQQTICGIINDWKSYNKAVQRYIEIGDPYSKSAPEKPGYKNVLIHKEIIIVRSAIKINEKIISIHLPDATSDYFKCNTLDFSYNQLFGKDHSKIVEKIEKIVDQLRQIRIKWYPCYKKWFIVIIYENDGDQLPNNYKNVMAIDIGLNNLCALTFRFGIKSYLINGRPLKCANRKLNYIIDELQRNEMRRIGSSAKYKDSSQIISIRNQRDNYVCNYIHQVSKKCIDIAIHEKCKIILVGDLKGIKNCKRNRSFVQIPLLRLIDMIKYKAEMRGIRVISINEAYTSVCSSIDLDEIKYKYNRINRRIYRGLFVSENGYFINSDINGSLNILRKFLNQVYHKRILASQNGIAVNLNGSIPELINFIRDKGVVVSPIKLQIF